MSLTTEIAQRSQAFPLGVRRCAGDQPDLFNVAVYAPDLDAVSVHYQDSDGEWNEAVLPELTDGVHHGLVEGMAESARYAFWPTDVPLQGEPGAAQLLLDPYGRAIDTVPAGEQTLYFSVFVDEAFNWGPSRRPAW